MGTRMHVTAAEERSKLMDTKHAMLVERAAMAREKCDDMVAEYAELCAENRRLERQRQLQWQTAKKRLEIRRKEVLRSDPHEFELPRFIAPPSARNRPECLSVIASRQRDPKGGAAVSPVDESTNTCLPVGLTA